MQREDKMDKMVQDDIIEDIFGVLLKFIKMEKCSEITYIPRINKRNKNISNKNL